MSTIQGKHARPGRGKGLPWLPLLCTPVRAGGRAEPGLRHRAGSGPPDPGAAQAGGAYRCAEQSGPRAAPSRAGGRTGGRADRWVGTPVSSGDPR
ncbi:hypothetical protein Ae168Ps1_4195c [Pseudonocardia sp. Ae168_Ps1]|nr:hypothetical protein Ae150APs1_4167c [Pseudonocardia sp. Ae150A_Ps1]OLL81789.1 hypothetical protein Ae168Ps1_4195c [Pseudonocardia sp. Ae168_Ps1]OLL84101.1 hypothetical protein Ae263Ps1_1156 [Pseudonocardia sp. Ae263_Ps1]OLL95881.1 hypothetical protein Ae356Ps1_5778c [Pseudonocardia sp. Ae356_Ps1]